MMKRKRKIILALGLSLLFVFGAFASEPCDHDFQMVEAPATCEESGYRGYVCSLCFQSKDYETIPQLGHLWGEWYVVTSPTCKSAGVQLRACQRCEKEQEEELPKLAHEYEIWVQKPTCGRAGYTLHTCVNCGHEEKTDRVEALGHDLKTLVVDATCTKDGYTQYQCTRCTYSRKEDLVEKTGHLYDSGTVEKEAGLHEEGRIRYVCLNCGESRTETIPEWGHPFADVADSSYYRDSVTWAYHTGITTGTDDVHFSPDEICTRGQVVAFLWRWAGCPAPEGDYTVFTDVKEGSFYEKAVLWAVQKGITKGMDETHFAPGAQCTRGQVVTLIHRYLGSPFTQGEIPFEDVAPEKYYAQAVLWACKSKITTGIDSNHFAPDGACTRGQIVTFLFRASEK